MDNEVNFLITVLYEEILMRCALKVKRDKLSGDCEKYPMELENRKQLHSLLPDHVKSCGPIVDVDSIFEIHCA